MSMYVSNLDSLPARIRPYPKRRLTRSRRVPVRATPALEPCYADFFVALPEQVLVAS
jgi:hypothetical protein